MITELIGTMRAVADDAAERTMLEEELTDDPDCLAELEFTYSVFRFRYTWGTVYELTFSQAADAEDKKACFALMPSAHVYLETVETATLGGAPNVTTEATHRFVTACG